MKRGDWAVKILRIALLEHRANTAVLGLGFQHHEAYDNALDVLVDELVLASEGKSFDYKGCSDENVRIGG